MNRCLALALHRSSGLITEEIIRNGLKFPVDSNEYEIPAELGEELQKLNQEMIDAENRQAEDGP